MNWKRITFTLFLLFVCSQIYAQLRQSSSWQEIKYSPENTISVVNNYENYLNTVDVNTLSDPEVFDIKQYYRFMNFWKSRVAVDASGNYDYTLYTKLAQTIQYDPFCEGSDPANWQLLGPVAYSDQNLGLVDEVLYDHSSGDYLISSDRGGLWKRRNNTQSWYNVTDDLRLPGLSATEIARNPYDNSHLLASSAGGIQTVNYGMGVLKSTDNGETWSVIDQFPYTEDSKVNKVLFDPTDTNPNDGVRTYALGKSKIYVSENGDTWSVFKDINADPALQMTGGNFLRDIEITQNGTIFITSKDEYGYHGRTFKYKNGIWSDLTSQFLTAQKSWFTTPTATGKIFLQVDGVIMNGSVENQERYIYKSTDYGETWTHIITFSSYNQKDEFEYSPTSNLIFFGGIQLQVAKDDNNSYPVYSNIIQGHADIRDFDFLGINSQGYEEVLIGNDGGVTLLKINPTNPYNNSWTNLNGDHLPIADFLGLSLSHDSKELLVGGIVHGHTYKLENGVWSNFSSGDGGDCEVNWFNSDIYYYQGNSFVRESIDGTIYYDSEWFIGMPIELDPSDPYIMYMGKRKDIG